MIATASLCRLSVSSTSLEAPIISRPFGDGSQFGLHFFNETNSTLRIAYCVKTKYEIRKLWDFSYGKCQPNFSEK
jgi:hypothetical protein